MGDSKNFPCPLSKPNGLVSCPFKGYGCQFIGQEYVECTEFLILIERTFRVRCVHCKNYRVNDEQEEFRWVRELPFIIPQDIRKGMGTVICPDCRPQTTPGSG